MAGNEKRLIDAKDVKELINGLSELPWEEEVDYLVDGLPTVDAVEVVHGRWDAVFEYEDFQYAYCSACGKRSEYMTNYCPNCGADMRGNDDDNDK